MPQVIYPQLSGVNWPSYLLQVWLTLHQAGVPPHHIRFLPEVGHFAVPEVTEETAEEDFDRRSEQAELRHPRGPQYDPQTGRVTVYQVDVDAVRPRLKVNVRADRRLQYATDAQGEEFVLFDRPAGRLAHFLEPLLAGLPADAPRAAPFSEAASAAVSPAGAELEDEAVPGRSERAEKPVARLTRQICARYPELMATVPYAERLILGRWADTLERALRDEDEQARLRFVEQAAQVVSGALDGTTLAGWFEVQTDKLPFLQNEAGNSVRAFAARARFREWGRMLTPQSLEARQSEAADLIAGLAPQEIAAQQTFFQEMAGRLGQETPRERYRIARELVEILTSEVFTSVAVLDYLWGMGWAHGSAADFRLPVGTLPAEGLFLSFTGGLSHRVLLLNMAQQWVREGGFLGVSDEEDSPASQHGISGSEMELFTEGEQVELWSLVTWRREAPDPLLLLQTALQRLVHPAAFLERDGYLNAGGGFGTLFAQVGATAALGGMVQVHYPGIRVCVPLSEEADEEAVRAKRKLDLLLRLFLPVCLRVEVVWQEAVARLGQGAFMQHPFQSGARLGQEAHPA